MSGAGTEPFATLGLPVAFGITKQQIESAYLARIAAAHPDHAGDVSGGDGSDAAALNDARRALRDDETRANLVLIARGGPSSAQDDSLPDGFLMEIMDARMAIEEAIAEGGPEERDTWFGWAKQRTESLGATVGVLLDAEDQSDDERAERFRTIRRALNAWRYYERLIEQLDPDYDPASADFS